MKNKTIWIIVIVVVIIAIIIYFYNNNSDKKRNGGWMLNKPICPSGKYNPDGSCYGLPSVNKNKICDSPPCTCSPHCGRGMYCNTSEGLCQPLTETIKK